jgi:hypothetical protein
MIPCGSLAAAESRNDVWRARLSAATEATRGGRSRVSRLRSLPGVRLGPIARPWTRSAAAASTLTDSEPPERNEPAGDVMYPPGEYPPHLAGPFRSTIEFAWELVETLRLRVLNCRMGSSKDCRLSDRFRSVCNLRISSPRSDPASLMRSACSSSRSMFPI